METQIELPTRTIIMNAILKLDFSTRALTNQEIAELLATHFCLSDEQTNAIYENSVQIWLNQVNRVI